jgi:2-oxoglutarate ferredoxin oxidoreductase subunit delta
MFLERLRREVETMPERIWRVPLDIEKVKHPRAEIHILKDQCKGCGYCISFCPKKVLAESEEINVRGVHPPKILDESKCILCNFCMAVCPDFAIFVVERQGREEK